MKKIVFPFLFVLMFGFSGCIKPGERIEYYEFVPALVDNVALFVPALKIPMDVFVTSQDLINKFGDDLFIGDAVIAFFQINHDMQTSTDYYTVSDLSYAKIQKTWAQPRSGGESMTDEFDQPIDGMIIYGIVDYCWFWGFSHKNTGEKDLFHYEMTYDPEQMGTPVVKIRAQKKTNGAPRACASDMSSFFWNYKDENNEVKFNVQFKTGVDNDGKDVYEYFRDYSGVVTFNAEVK